MQVSKTLLTVYMYAKTVCKYLKAILFRTNIPIKPFWANVPLGYHRKNIRKRYS